MMRAASVPPSALAGFVLLSLSACLGPAYETITANALARDPMRKAVTPTVDMYYPAGHEEAAQRALQTVQRCLQTLQTHLVDQQATDAAVVVLHRGELNNAYVQPGSGGAPMHMVLPIHESLEMFNLLNFGLVEVPEISCHEALHYVTFQQVHAFWRGFNTVFGNAVAPNGFFDSWFHEGMATYYESRLNRGVGRPESLLWRGMFQAGVVGRNYRLHAGDLSELQREIGAFGAHYLVGMHFVEYLAQTYGEAKLWQVVDIQSRSLFSPFGVTLRFAEVYGKDIGQLFDEFVATLPQRVPHRVRPANQVELRPPMGYWSRLTTCPAQRVVAATYEGVDQVPVITAWKTDGSELFSRRLTDVLPGRERVIGDVKGVSGLSFSPDCQRLFLTFADVRADTSYISGLWELNGQDGSTVQHWDDLSGVGGSLHPDGKAYAYIHVADGVARLMVRQLSTGEDVALPPVPEVTSLGAPSFSPDGASLAFAARTSAGFNLFVQHADGFYEQLTDDSNFNYAPRWFDEHHLVFTRGHEGHLQAFSYDLASRTMVPLTDAPYAVLDPAPLGDGRVALLNAVGWTWSLDITAPAPAASEVAVRTDEEAGETETQASALSEAMNGVDLHVSSDTPYSGTDGLATPTFRAPWALWSTSAADPNMLGYVVGADVVGHDRLGWHNYQLQVTYNSFAKLPSVTLGYLNRQLMPWSMTARASHIATESDRTWLGILQVSRPWWTNHLSFNLTFLDSAPNPRVPASRTLPHYRLWGPGGVFQYVGAESTPYGGQRRGFGFGVGAQGYPKALGNTATVADLSANIFGVIPLPFSVRHNLSLWVRGRALLGAPERILRTGNVLTGSEIFTSSAVDGSANRTLAWYRDMLALQESVRGYEDFGWLANTTAVAAATYTYPIIIDYGWHSLLWLFPAFFINEVDVQLFATAAVSSVAPGRQPWHRAVGGMVQLQTTLGRLISPTLAYQVAYRIDEVLPPVRHEVLLSF